MSLHLNNIKLTHYKNYNNFSLDFHPRLNAILGLNGMGKTNLLDSIYYSCLGKSYFSSGDRNVVMHGEEFFRIESSFMANGVKEKFIAKVIPGKSKEISIDGKRINKISEHVGKYPIVIIAPADIQLLLEGSEPRRNFLNQCLIQFDKDYTEALIKYNKLLKQRNTLLKSFSENKYWDQNLLDSYTEGMAGPSTYIYKKRTALAELISPHFEHMYNRISKNRESCKLKYKSNLADSDFISLMEKNKEKDRILARTSAGIHKDDIKFIMNDVQLKPYGSQGQLKSFILALKLAQYHILKDQSKLTPILILDDLFDKLDKHRVVELLAILHDEAYGQVFLTDKDENDIPQFLDQISDDYAIFVIHEGSLKYSKEKR